jgi:WD40 repeat protein
VSKLSTFLFVLSFLVLTPAFGILPNPADTLYAFEVSPDGRQAVTMGESATVRLWDLVQHRLYKAWDMPASMRCAAFSPDSRRLAMGGGDGLLHIYQGDKPISKVQMPGKVTSVTWLGDDVVAIARFSVMRVINGRAHSMPLGDDVNDLATAGRTLVLGGDGHLRLWSGHMQDDVKLRWSVGGLSVSDTGRVALFTSNKELKVYDMRQHKIVASVDTAVESVALSRDGRTVVTDANIRNGALAVVGHLPVTPQAEQFLPDGTLAVALSLEHVQVYRLPGTLVGDLKP